MSSSLVTTALRAYSSLWTPAMPLLRRNPRLLEGWGQRTLQTLPAEAHVWIQAASAGEAYLAWEILSQLENPLAEPLRVLVTTNTGQGMEILRRAADELHGTGRGLAIQPWYFPLDAPRLMRRFAAHVRPRTAVLLESEMWPGFLSALREQGSYVLLANGRMRAKSLAAYLTWPGMFRALAPDRVLAMSETDAARFATLFGRDRVGTMHNIKFDRTQALTGMSRKDNPLAEYVRPGADFVPFGSVRKEEEGSVVRMIGRILRNRPSAVIGLFPRHMARMEPWQNLLENAGFSWTPRSGLQGAALPGSVVLWDAFGELVPAYRLAKAAFVGGSLAPLGGQNFLEPLTCGVTPVTGPSWENFAWLGREIVDSGLAIEAPGWREAADAVCALLEKTPSRRSVMAATGEYIKDRRGGAKTVGKLVADSLINR